MKKWISVILAVCLSAVPVWGAAVSGGVPGEVASVTVSGWPAPPETNCETVVLMEAETGAVLYDKGMNDLRYPASITKLMTLLLAVENSALDDPVTFSENSVKNISEGTNIGMMAGETVTMKDCLHAITIASANEVANQVAETVGGTEERFVEMMNQRAKEIGCQNTNFVNASGMPDDNHYSTAYDFALIMREGIKNPTFCEILSVVSYEIPATNLSGPRYMHTHLPLIAIESPGYYEGCIGGKTGLTVAAQNTLVAAAQKNGITYIVTAMRSPSLDLNCADASALWDYAYESFSVVDAGIGHAVVPKGVTADRIEIRQQEADGRITEEYYYEGYPVGTGEAAAPAEAPVPSETPVPEPTAETSEETAVQKQQSEEKPEESSHMKLLLIILAGMLLVLAILSTALVLKNRKRS